MLHTVLDIAESFDKNSCSLLNDAGLREGAVRVDTNSGAHLTSKECMEALHEALER